MWLVLVGGAFHVSGTYPEPACEVGQPKQGDWRLSGGIHSEKKGKSERDRAKTNLWLPKEKVEEG